MMNGPRRILLRSICPGLSSRVFWMVLFTMPSLDLATSRRIRFEEERPEHHYHSSPSLIAREAHSGPLRFDEELAQLHVSGRRDHNPIQFPGQRNGRHEEAEEPYLPPPDYATSSSSRYSDLYQRGPKGGQFVFGKDSLEPTLQDVDSSSTKPPDSKDDELQQDGYSSGGGGINKADLNVKRRMDKLDYYFDTLRVYSEDCRQRLICEVSRDKDKFHPLSAVLLDETDYKGSYQNLASRLLGTAQGARLLSYIEASFRGQDGSRRCDAFEFRCPSSTEDIINFQSLLLWREMLKWLTVKVIAKAP